MRQRTYLFNLSRSDGVVETLVVRECLFRQLWLDLVQCSVDGSAELHPALSLDPFRCLLGISTITLDLQCNLEEAQQHLAVCRFAELVHLIQLLGDLCWYFWSRVQSLQENDHLVGIPTFNVTFLERSGLEGNCAGDDLNPASGKGEGLLGEGGVVLHVDGERGAFSVEPRVPVDFLECIRSGRVVLEVREEVFLPLLGGDGAVVKCMEVRLCVREEIVQTTNSAFKVQQEVGALLVRNRAESIVGILTIFEGGNEALESRVLCKLLQRVLERLGSDDVGKSSMSGPLFGPMDILE